MTSSVSKPYISWASLNFWLKDVFEKSGNLPTRGLGIETIILLSFLASILKSLTDLQKIQIPHDWFRDFRAEKLLQLADPATEFKLKSKIEPLLVI